MAAWCLDDLEGWTEIYRKGWYPFRNVYAMQEAMLKAVARDPDISLEELADIGRAADEAADPLPDHLARLPLDPKEYPSPPPHDPSSVNDEHYGAAASITRIRFDHRRESIRQRHAMHAANPVVKTRYLKAVGALPRDVNTNVSRWTRDTLLAACEALGVCKPGDGANRTLTKQVLHRVFDNVTLTLEQYTDLCERAELFRGSQTPRPWVGQSTVG